METNNNTISVVLGEDTDIAKVKNKKTIVKNAITAILGLVILLATREYVSDTSIMYMPLLSLSFLAAGYGVVRVFFPSKNYVHIPSRSIVREMTIFYSPEKMEYIIDAIKKNKLEAIEKFIDNNNAGIRLDILASKDASYAKCQVSKWVPYTYEPVSDIFVLNADSVKYICSVVDKK